MNNRVKTVWTNKNLQLYFAGQIVSLIGTWMQQMALSWLVYRLTNSPFMLGLIGFTSQAPSLLLTPLAGIVVDNTNRHRLLLITQMLAMIQATTLTILVLTGIVQIWHLVLLGAFLGAITAFELPTRQSFLIDLLENKEQLREAIGINSSINTLTRLIGPFIAGLLVTGVGEGICFLINAVSYTAVIMALLYVKAQQPILPSSKKDALSQLKEGLNYVINFIPIRDLILFLALLGLFAMPFAVLMPVFAKDVFHGDALTLGCLSGASGIGSVMGALFLSSRKRIKDLSKWITVGCSLWGLALILFGLSSFLPLSLLVVAIAGFGNMIVLAGSNTIIQTIVDEDKRGRVMSFLVMAFIGLSPFGCMVAGALANIMGVGPTVMLTGLSALVLILIFGLRIMNIHLQVQPIQLKEAIIQAESEMTITHV